MIACQDINETKQVSGKLALLLYIAYTVNPLMTAMKQRLLLRKQESDKNKNGQAAKRI